MVVPISYENPLFAIFEADDAFKIKSEFVRSLLFLEFDKFMNLNYMKFEGFRKTVKYSASLDDSFIKRFISSDNSNTDMYISISNNKQCVNKSIVAVPDGQTFDAPSDQTSNFNKTGDKSGPTLFKSFKRSFSSVSSSRYNDLVKKRSSDLKYKFNKCEIQDIHRYYLSNFNKSIPVSKLNPKLIQTINWNLKLLWIILLYLYEMIYSIIIIKFQIYLRSDLRLRNILNIIINVSRMALMLLNVIILDLYVHFQLMDSWEFKIRLNHHLLLHLWLKLLIHIIILPVEGSVINC